MGICVHEQRKKSGRWVLCCVKETKSAQASNQGFEDEETKKINLFQLIQKAKESNIQKQ